MIFAIILFCGLAAFSSAAPRTQSFYFDGPQRPIHGQPIYIYSKEGPYSAGGGSPYSENYLAAIPSRKVANAYQQDDASEENEDFDDEEIEGPYPFPPSYEAIFPSRGDRENYNPYTPSKESVKIVSKTPIQFDPRGQYRLGLYRNDKPVFPPRKKVPVAPVASDSSEEENDEDYDENEEEQEDYNGPPQQTLDFNQWFPNLTPILPGRDSQKQQGHSTQKYRTGVKSKYPMPMRSNMKVGQVYRQVYHTYPMNMNMNMRRSSYYYPTMMSSMGRPMSYRPTTVKYSSPMSMPMRMPVKYSPMYTYSPYRRYGMTPAYSMRNMY